MSIVGVAVGAPGRGQLARGRISAQDLIVLRRGLPRVELPAAFDLDWDQDLGSDDRAARARASVEILRGAGLLLALDDASDDDDARPESDAGEQRLDGDLSTLGATWWAVATAPDVAVEVTAWDRQLVRHGWFGVRGDVAVGLVRARVVLGAPQTPGTGPALGELDPIEMTVSNASRAVDLVEELWPDDRGQPGSDVPATTLDLVDAEAFLLALAAGDHGVVDAVVARAGLTRWPLALRGLEDGVLSGVDLTVVAGNRSTGHRSTGHRSTGHWVLGAEGWRGLSVAMSSAVRPDSVGDAGHAVQVRATGQSRATMRHALVLGMARAWEVDHG